MADLNDIGKRTDIMATEWIKPIEIGADYQGSSIVDIEKCRKGTQL
jgi:hypothetical protein